MNRFKKLSALIRKNGGSTIVGVLAALVFIGIVTGFMVKNTGAQSAASIGYGLPLVMQSTVNSGIVATEGFFSDETKGLAFINTMADGKFLHEGDPGSRKRLGNSDQYFSSKVVSVDNRLNKADEAERCLLAGFEVSAGKNAKGKELRKGRAFYLFGNLEEQGSEPSEKTLKPKNGPGLNNAFFSKGGVNNADAGMDVRLGGATFWDTVAFQNAPAVFQKVAYFGKRVEFPSTNVTFYDSAYFKGSAVFQGEAKFETGASAYFGGAAEFYETTTFGDVALFMKTVKFTGCNQTECEKEITEKVNGVDVKKKVKIPKTVVTFNDWARFGGNVGSNSTTTFEVEGIFYGETYFATGLTFRNADLTFYHRLGFDGNIDHNNRLMSSKQNSKGDAFDVWINGKFINPNSTVIKGANVAKHDLRYSTKFDENHTTNCKNFASLGKNSGLDKTVLGDSRFTTIHDDIVTNKNVLVLSSNNDRGDDPLSLDTVEKAEKAGKIVVVEAYKALTTSGSNGQGSGTADFDINVLNNAYTSAKSKNTLFNGEYLVIRQRSSDNVSINFTNPDPGVFNYKLIFIIESGQLNVNTRFYESGSNSSTLIFVGKNATLGQFGSKGDFRGFIFIEAGNNNSNSIKFTGATSKIIGAVHNFSTKAIGWNTGVPGYSIPIVFDKNVLSGFNTLYGKADEPDEYEEGEGGGGDPTQTITVKDPDQGGIKVKPLGIYFY